MLKSRLPEIAAKLGPALEQVAETGAEMIRDDAKTRIRPHRLSGDLEDAIHTDKQPEGVYVVAGDDDAFYGHIVEHGSSHSAPYPFLVPAFEENVDRITKLVRTALQGL